MLIIIDIIHTVAHKLEGVHEKNSLYQNVTSQKERSTEESNKTVTVKAVRISYSSLNKKL